MALPFVEPYFSTARERYKIKLRRDLGEPPPWTSDPHFQAWRFCNVHREDDRTTVWFRENIRKHLSGLAVVEATLIFRWFNRIETGERIEDLLLNGWDTEEARRRLTGISPIVTGAYIIKAGDGVSKLEGILACIDAARPQLPKMVERWGPSLEAAWTDLKTLHFMGGFMAYEAISDLRWTDVLYNASDIMTWANAGPGCARGLGWVTHENSNVYTCSPRNQKIMLELMQELLRLSKNTNYWPYQRLWEMREVEHWCCEFDKMMRACSGQSLKRRYQSQ